MKSKLRKKPQPAQFAIVWEFLPRAGKRREFEKAYGPDGVWGRLFSRGEGFVRTELLRVGKSLRYFTIDAWRSREAYERFRKNYVAEYGEIDAQCESLTESETKVGEFNILASARQATARAMSSKSTPVRLRSAIIDDVESIMAIERSAQGAAHWPESVYRELFKAGALPRIALVAHVKSAGILGFVIARIAGGECELENIVVDKGRRRSGVGSKLIGSLVKAVRARDVPRIFLEVRESNAAARRLYEKGGFKEVGRRGSYYADPVEDAVLYACAL